MRRVVMLLLLAFPLFAKPFDVEADLSRLTDAREWLLTFEAGARVHANKDVPASDWLRASAVSAREVQLAETATVLDTAADVLTNKATIEKLEQTFRKTLDAPVYVIPFIDEKKLTDIVVAVPDRRASRELLPDRIADVERALPGFDPRWLDWVSSENISRIATLQFRAGKFAKSTTPGSKIGHVWIVYDNMIAADWFATRVLPAAGALMPASPGHVNAVALVVWYALRAPMDNHDQGPLHIAKADVLGTLAAGAYDDDLATLLAVSFDTLHESANGNAPRANETASAMLLNFAIEHDALRFANDRWSMDPEAFRNVLREMAIEILTIESSHVANQGRAFVACYGAMTPELERTVKIIDALPKITIEPRYALPSRDH